MKFLRKAVENKSLKRNISWIQLGFLSTSCLHFSTNTDYKYLCFNSKKQDSEASAAKKKVNKGKEGSENSDLEKTPPPSPHPEDEDDPGVQVMLLLKFIVGFDNLES